MPLPVLPLAFLHLVLSDSHSSTTLHNLSDVSTVW